MKGVKVEDIIASTLYESNLDKRLEDRSDDKWGRLRTPWLATQRESALTFEKEEEVLCVKGGDPRTPRSVPRTRNAHLSFISGGGAGGRGRARARGAGVSRRRRGCHRVCVGVRVSGRKGALLSVVSFLFFPVCLALVGHSKT